MQIYRYIINRLQMGPSPDLLDRYDYTPLHWAAYNGHDNCVELLLDQDKRSSPDFIGNRFSPLHCAVSVAIPHPFPITSLIY